MHGKVCKMTAVTLVRMDLASLHRELVDSPDLLIVQDLDGVCIPLVKDPLTRTLSPEYVQAAARLRGSFAVLTNGEHEGRRGVNRLVETALGDSATARSHGLYLPGLAAGGVQLQDEFGHVTHPGVSESEISFLASVPERMKALMSSMLPALMPELNDEQLAVELELAVLDTQLSPTINLNHLFSRTPDDVEHQRRLQSMLESLMQQLMAMAVAEGLQDSFFLHVAPNLGRDSLGHERLKPAEQGNVGSTDIQFMLRGAIKEVGLLVLINRHIQARTGTAPLGEEFNVRTAPHDHASLLALCKQRIPVDQMPHLVGVGDTVTSTINPSGDGWLRGGSDRGFLTLLQELGCSFGRPNRVVLVDSSAGEVDRPSLADGSLAGISDPEDPLHFDVCIPGGPEAYVNWFSGLSKSRSELTA
ncbi:Glucosylglycerol-phosphate phosphatase [Synechococcus sp. MIT S9504]|nr:Glucosylglycerol-phosphate phosphatase [Synechococcus sp. MIT S9504]